MRFFQQLIETHGLADFQADWPKQADDPTGGYTKFGRYLRGIGVSSSFIANVRRIVVSGDHDDDESFERICRQLVAAGYKAPQAPKEFISTEGKPDISILLLPEDSTGCLETMCYTAACVKWPHIQTPLENYMASTPADTWRPNKRDKARIHCVLASTCEQRPDVSLQDLWHQDGEFHIPLNAQAFQGIVQFLTSS